MESIWFIIVITLSFCATVKALINLLQTPKKLPPGPVSIPIITSFQWLRKSFADLEPTLRNLKTKYGPIVTLSIGHRKSIFITTSSLAHQALIQNGAIFADRPPAPATSKIISSNQHNISGASYGPLWRLLRRNLTMQILHPSKIKSFSPARNWVLNIIKESIKKESNSGKNPVLVVDHFQFGMFCLLVFMCFGKKLDEKKIREVESVQRSFLLGFGKFQILNFFPRLTKIIMKKRWEDFRKLRSDQEKVLIPLIRSRQEQMKKTFEDNEKSLGLCYVDSLLNLELPDEGGRKLTEHEIVSLCSEFLNAGTDTTSTALQWVMANLVKYQEIQSKLYDEIKTLYSGDDEIKEEDLKKLPYLKAVILEGLRRHPPGHFVLPHAVTQDIGLDGYVVPKEATVNVMIAEIGWDSKVWEDPMMFKPERFLSKDGILNEELSDVTGNKEVKMIPFGAGRRMCPASGLAMLHLEYFVANLIKEFKWTAKVGDDIDLSEKQEFTIVMKNPLWAHVSPRKQDC
ncbi:cytochrome P450 89A2-like [Papaver somniferum]|uniref:cytochrome P450 89A2-like n=1 Tax=Papaver somniferum TaxID=3469 RepID=UPI000E6FDA58|nr:cytochrome P450 89A2-like [Papaver somniferum]XP_026388163.1 cytochrome P450 89A2-like [Papaver somniferum]